MHKLANRKYKYFGYFILKLYVEHKYNKLHFIRILIAN